MLLNGGSVHGLSRRNNALSDRMDRASFSSFPEGSAARLRDFSSHFMALAMHMSLSLASHSTTTGNSVLMEPSLHHSCGNSVLMESLSLINLSVEFFNPATLLLLVLHVSVNGHLMALSQASGQSRPHSTQTSPPVALITFVFSVTACAVSDFTVIVVTEGVCIRQRPFDCDLFDLRHFDNCILGGPLCHGYLCLELFSNISLHCFALFRHGIGDLRGNNLL